MPNSDECITELRSSEPRIDPRAANTGFALPMVLVALLVLSVLTGASMVLAAGLSERVREIQLQLGRETALRSAEAEATFVLLTRMPVDGGMYTGDPSEYEIGPLFDLEFSIPQDEWGPDRLWALDGGIRRFGEDDAAILVRARDTSGLAALNQSNDQIWRAILNAVAPQAPQDRLIARLRDFTDPDFIPVFLGAERADYRLLEMKEPTNQPLRSVGELRNVLSWDDALSADDFEALSQIITPISPPLLRARFAHPTLREAALEAERGLSGEEFAALAGAAPPSGRVRLELIDMSGEDGFVRVVEIDKPRGDSVAPFRRHVIGEFALETLLEPVSLDGAEIVSIAAPDVGDTGQ